MHVHVYLYMYRHIYVSMFRRFIDKGVEFTEKNKGVEFTYKIRVDDKMIDRLRAI